MDRIQTLMADCPSQKKVALLLLSHGISVKDGNAYCGDIMQSDTAIARAADVDSRVVKSTINKISSIPELADIFGRLKSTLLMSDLAPAIGCSTIDITPTDARIPGILAEITDTIYRQGLTVRQAVVDDPGNRMNSHLIVVVDGDIPPNTLMQIKKCRGVSSVTIR